MIVEIGNEPIRGGWVTISVYPETSLNMPFDPLADQTTDKP